MRARLTMILAGSVALGGCAYGYGGYGSYGSVSVGVGSGYGGYYDPYYGGYGYGSYGYSTPYWGWYDDYYYPGTGYYVYDRYRRPHVWSDRQRRYWSSRRDRAVTRDQGTRERTTIRENWSDFDRRGRTDRDRSRRDRHRDSSRDDQRDDRR